MTLYSHEAHAELFNRLKALEPGDRWVYVDPRLLLAAIAMMG